jgi:hypothetical protein
MKWAVMEGFRAHGWPEGVPFPDASFTADRLRAQHWKEILEELMAGRFYLEHWSNGKSRFL